MAQHFEMESPERVPRRAGAHDTARINAPRWFVRDVRIMRYDDLCAMFALCDCLVVLDDDVRQELGPYAMWQHDHSFAATSEKGECAGTLCYDYVR